MAVVPFYPLNVSVKEAEAARFKAEARRHGLSQRQYLLALMAAYNQADAA